MPKNKMKSMPVWLLLIISGGLSVLISLILIFIQCVVLYSFEDPLSAVGYVTYAAMFLSFFISGIVSSKVTGAGFISGLIVGSFLALCSVFVSLFSDHSVSSFVFVLIVRLCCVGVSVLGSLAASYKPKKKNLRNEYRKMIAKR